MEGTQIGLHYCPHDSKDRRASVKATLEDVQVSDSLIHW
jgi:hypothetical protein